MKVIVMVFWTKESNIESVDQLLSRLMGVKREQYVGCDRKATSLKRVHTKSPDILFASTRVVRGMKEAFTPKAGCLPGHTPKIAAGVCV